MTAPTTGVSVYQNDGALLCILYGEIDHHTARTIRTEIDTALMRARPARLKLDLSRVSFMDSAGLGLILGRFRSASSIGADCVLLDPAPGVTRILDLAGIERLIRIERSASAAGAPQKA
jgi:stage II sporulation protein AA (anti-sigma F factor antagonist)